MSNLTINLVQGSVTLGFTPDAAKDLKQEIAKLMKSLKANATSNAGKAGARPTKQPSMEYRYAGDVFLEVFCNPNIYPSPFAAKVLLTVRDERIRITTEAELPQLIEDLNSYLEQN